MSIAIRRNCEFTASLVTNSRMHSHGPFQKSCVSASTAAGLHQLLHLVFRRFGSARYVDPNFNLYARVHLRGVETLRASGTRRDEHSGVSLLLGRRQASAR